MKGSVPTFALLEFIRQVHRHRAMILALAVRDLQARYVGTLGGMLWAFAHPLAIVVVFYFVFAVGFKAQGPSNTSFLLWFVCGLAPWFFFNDTLLAITNSVTGNAHLVKKTVFPTEVLPLIHVVSSLFPHLIFMVILAGMLIFFNIPLMVERAMVLYFLLCSIVLVLGLGWLLAALQVFYRDISQALTIILNLWFWITPVVWSQEIMPQEYRSLLFYNPLYYIVEGYRGLIIYDSIAWPSLQQTIYFWSITLGFIISGTYVFGRLKPEFADVM
jgi:ABC-type polysaccharide/polyol phosphate export permease